MAFWLDISKAETSNKLTSWFLNSSTFLRIPSKKEKRQSVPHKYQSRYFSPWMPAVSEAFSCSASLYSPWIFHCVCWSIWHTWWLRTASLSGTLLLHVAPVCSKGPLCLACKGTQVKPSGDTSRRGRSGGVLSALRSCCEHLSGLPLDDFLQMAWNEMKRFIGSEEESGQEGGWGGWGSGRAQVPSDVSGHVVSLPAKVYGLHSLSLSLCVRVCNVCITSLFLSLDIYISLSLALSPSLGAIFVHSLWNLLPFLSLFLGTWSQAANHPNGISMGAIFLDLFLESFLEGVRGIEMLSLFFASPLPSS